MKKFSKKTLTEAKTKLSPKFTFLFDYKKNKNHIYGFVEGVDDIPFYQHFLKMHLFRTNCETHFYPCGNKQAVLKIYSELDWKNFSTERVLFFVDRDLSDFFKEEKIPKKQNIYITDGYSIENSIVTAELLIRHLQEKGIIQIIDEKTKKSLKESFDSLRSAFCSSFLDIMIWYVSLKLKGKQPELKKIRSRDIVQISKMKLTPCTPKEKARIFEAKTGLKPVASRGVKAKFLMCANKEKCIKGKFLLEFLSMFIDDFFKSCSNIPFLQACAVRKHGVSTDIGDLAHRCNCPKSLNRFFSRTVDRR